MTYKASLDTLAKVVTIVISVLFAVIIVGQIAYINQTGKAIPIFTSVLLTLVYIAAYSFRPINYQLTADKLIIHRPLRDISVDRKDIRSVEQIDKQKLSSTVRTFGVGGLFGYFGKFANTQLGNMTWYATKSKDNVVLIKTISNRKIILTPNDPEKFVSAFVA